MKAVYVFVFLAWTSALMSQDLTHQQRAELLKKRGDLERQLQTINKQLGLPIAQPAEAPVAPPSAERTPVGTDFIENLKRKGYRLQRAPGALDEVGPAEFSFTRDFQAGTDTTFAAEFFLAKQVDLDMRDLYLLPSIQGQLASGEQDKNDAWRVRLDFEYWHTDLDSLSINLWGGPMLESNHDFSVNRFGGELWASPTYFPLFIGNYSGSKDSSLQFRWRPYVGVDFGSIFDGEQKKADLEDDTRLFFRVHGDVKLNFLSSALNFKDVLLFSDYTMVGLPDRATDHLLHYVETGLTFKFNKYAGFTLAYKVGQRAPDYEKEETLNGSFTIGF